MSFEELSLSHIEIKSGGHIEYVFLYYFNCSSIGILHHVVCPNISYFLYSPLILFEFHGCCSQVVLEPNISGENLLLTPYLVGLKLLVIRGDSFNHPSVSAI